MATVIEYIEVRRDGVIETVSVSSKLIESSVFEVLATNCLLLRIDENVNSYHQNAIGTKSKDSPQSKTLSQVF